MPAVTFPAAVRHRFLTGNKLYCLVTEAHRCQQLGQDCYAALPRAGFEFSTRCATTPPIHSYYRPLIGNDM